MRKILLIGLAAALAACGQSPASVAPSAGLPPGSAPAARQPAPTSAPPTSVPPTMQLSATPAVAPPTSPATATAAPATPAAGGGRTERPPAALLLAAQRQLAAHLQLDPNAIELQSANQRDWPDGALGCPKPATAYPQVIVPGFLLIFTSQGQPQSYALHTSLDARQMVLCANGQPIDLAPAEQPTASGGGGAAAIGPAGQRAVDLAQAALARELAIQPSDVALLAAEQVEWNDSSLGCPQPNRSYLQVITPGYKITLQAERRTYEYHTDLGKRVVKCGR